MHKNRSLITTLVLGFLGLASVPAAAVNFTVTSTPYTAGAPTSTTLMCGASDPACRDHWTGNYAIVTGSVTNRYLTPAGWTGEYSVVPGPLTGPGGTADLSFAGIGAINSWSFLWGSAGVNNVLQLFYQGSASPFTLTGAGVISNSLAETAAQRINRWVTITGDSPFTAISARFTHPSFGFENTAHAVDKATGAVPEPATWAMLVFGFGLVGVARRRKTLATVSS